MPKRIILSVHLVPNSRKNGIAGEYGDKIKITVKAPAVDGRANEALVNFIAEEYKVSKSLVHIVSGFKNRNKILEIIKD
jgi:uncharacterized protein (TIGR00251 family)